MKKILLVLVLTLLPSLAFAQSQRNPCYYTGASPGPGNGCIPVSTANPLPVTTGGGGGGTSSAFNSAFPANGTAIGLSDGTYMKAWLTALIQAKTAVNGNNMGSVANWLYNAGATSFDAAPGDATNGAWVNVKTSVLPTGGATSANQSSQITQETATATVLGTTADTACATDAGTCTVAALIKRNNQNVTTLNTTAGSAVPAGTNLIGKVGIDQTTPGTTNGVQINAALPAGTNTIGNVGSDPSSGKGTPASAAINVSSATTTQLVAISGTTKIYVTSLDVIAGGTGNITFEYGTGSNCGTGTTALTGAYNLTAQAGIAKGSGVGAILVVPAGNALCILTSAAVQMSGSVSYQQF